MRFLVIHLRKATVGWEEAKGFAGSSYIPLL